MLGQGAWAYGANSVAIGTNAQAHGNGSVALGANSIATEDNTVSVGAPGMERRITNVAPGVNSTDAVNVSQLLGLQGQVNQLTRMAYSGIAMSMALSGNYMPPVHPGKVGTGVGIGTFGGQSALAVTVKGLSKSGRAGWGIGLATNGKTAGASFGVGVEW
jgi:autotransporter adhesin